MQWNLDATLWQSSTSTSTNDSLIKMIPTATNRERAIRSNQRMTSKQQFRMKMLFCPIQRNDSAKSICSSAASLLLSERSLRYVLSGVATSSPRVGLVSGVEFTSRSTGINARALLAAYDTRYQYQATISQEPMAKVTWKVARRNIVFGANSFVDKSPAILYLCLSEYRYEQL